MPLNQRVQRSVTITWSSTFPMAVSVWLCTNVTKSPRWLPLWQLSLACQLASSKSQNAKSSFTAHHSMLNITVLHGWLTVLQWTSDRNMSHNYILAACYAVQAQEKDKKLMFSAVCWLLFRSFQGDLPSGSWIYLLALWCADFCQTSGRGWCAEHRSVVGAAEPHLPSASILPPLTAAAFWATTPQLPTDATNTPISWLSWDTTSAPTPSDSTAASPSLSASQRNT